MDTITKKPGMQDPISWAGVSVVLEVSIRWLPSVFMLMTADRSNVSTPKGNELTGVIGASFERARPLLTGQRHLSHAEVWGQLANGKRRF